MVACGVEHPDPKKQGVTCILPTEPEHERHSSGYGGLAEHWPNRSYGLSYLGESPQIPSTRQGQLDWMNGAARRAQKERRARSPRRNSTIAWEDYQDRLPRRNREVLDKLMSMIGIWINGVDLHTQELGGSQGVKRLRELRADFDANPRLGWRIEERRVRDSDWDYRLVRRIPEG